MEKITIQSSLNQYQGDCGDITSMKALNTKHTVSSNSIPLAIVGETAIETLSEPVSFPSPHLNITSTTTNTETVPVFFSEQDLPKNSYEPQVNNRDTVSNTKSFAEYGGSRSLDIGHNISSGHRLSFRKSHTCGSLYAKCNCDGSSTPLPPQILFSSSDNTLTANRTETTSTSTAESQNFIEDTTASAPSAVGRTSTTDRAIVSLLNTTDANGTNSLSDNSGRNNASFKISINTGSLLNTNNLYNNNNSDNNNTTTGKRKKKKIFQSFSHPDTKFIFTDENKTPSREQTNRRDSIITTKSGKLEIRTQPTKRSSTPNIGNYTILDVAIHPEILVKITPRKSTASDITESSSQRNCVSSDSTSRSYLDEEKLNKHTSNPSDCDYQSSDSEKSVEVLCDDDDNCSQYDVIVTNNDIQSSEYDDSDSIARADSNDSDNKYDYRINSNDKNRLKRFKQLKKGQAAIDSAQKYFQESGILGPLTKNSTRIIRKTSKILQECNFVEQIRKNSKLLRQQSFDTTKISPHELSDYTSRTVLMSYNNINNNNNNLNHITCNSINYNKNFNNKNNMDRDNKIKTLEEEISILKDVIKGRDNEIGKLKREIHKLKSVLQQTTSNKRHVADGDLLSTLQSHHEMAGQKSPMTVVPCPNSNSLFEYESTLIERDSKNNLTEIRLTSTKNPNLINSTGECNRCPNEFTEGLFNGNGTTKSSHLFLPLNLHAVKKQGVSGESCDAAHHHLQKISIPKYEKDFSSKQLIKEAIMDNDFLKNIDSTQVRELVESMYSLEVAKGEYVIREGAAGAHLYVSAEGEFEVIKGDKVLGTMGPRKAFGELAILYNCTRTASIRVLSDDASVWVLDRRIFQQIMMRTGMQRIEENVKFLRSVPLLKNLSNDILTKIADVLEVEFYPAGSYIIRQGASGDTFFLISQGNVKVTQRLANSIEEKEIRTLNRGDYFGEQALINEDKRTANIIALSPGVECLTLDRESFTHLIGDLCELKEKDYGDEDRVLAMKTPEASSKFFGTNVKQEMLDIKLVDLETVATLGIGGFGRVELVKCLRNNKMETYALKCLKKQHIVDTRQQEHVFSERTIMLSCNTPFICRLYRTFKDSKYVYMLLEACMGGEVWTILRDRGCFDDNTTQFIIGCVLQAFEYLHTRGIIYRDLKPENLMLSERGYVKLVDFGFAKHIGPSNKTWTFCGTPEYVAPEIILNKGHDRAVDYWALGVLIHELLNGTPPFTANDPMKTYNIILKGIDMVDFPKHMSRAAVTLIKRLCRDVPAERLGYQKGGIQDIKKHKWFQGFDWDGLSNLTLIPPFLRPVSNQLDTSYFDNFPKDKEVPPDEFSGWDKEF